MRTCSGNEPAQARKGIKKTAPQRIRKDPHEEWGTSPTEARETIPSRPGKPAREDYFWNHFGSKFWNQFWAARCTTIGPGGSILVPIFGTILVPNSGTNSGPRVPGKPGPRCSILVPVFGTKMVPKIGTNFGPRYYNLNSGARKRPQNLEPKWFQKLEPKLIPVGLVFLAHGAQNWFQKSEPKWFQKLEPKSNPANQFSVPSRSISHVPRAKKTAPKTGTKMAPKTGTQISPAGWFSWSLGPKTDSRTWNQTGSKNWHQNRASRTKGPASKITKAGKWLAKPILQTQSKSAPGFPMAVVCPTVRPTENMNEATLRGTICHSRALPVLRNQNGSKNWNQN